VNGPVTIDDAHLATTLEKALYPNGRSWRIIDASGGISGSFSSISTDFTSSTINLKQAVQGGSLDLVISRTPYASFGNTANQSAVGAGLESLLASARGDMANLLFNMDFAMNPAQISNILKGLNPEMYTAFPAAGLEIASVFSRIVALRQQKVEMDPGEPAGNQGHQWNFWGQALGNWLNRDNESGVPGYALKTGGAVIGLDRGFGSFVRAGAVLGYHNSTLSWDDPGNSGRIDGKHIGVYGEARHGNFYLEAIAGYTSLSNSADRQTSTPLNTAKAVSSFDSSVWDTTLSGGYDFTLGRLRLSPIISFNYQHLSQNGFNESGVGDFGVRIQDTTVESLTSSVGLKAGGIIPIGQWRFLPRATLSLVHQFKDDPVNLTANFVNYPEGRFHVSSAKPAANECQASLGLTAEYNKLSFFVDLFAVLAGNRNSIMPTGGITWTF
jgi:outer membrane autotransporter protein